MHGPLSINVFNFNISAKIVQKEFRTCMTFTNDCISYEGVGEQCKLSNGIRSEALEALALTASLLTKKA